MSKAEIIEKAIKQMEDWAADSAHGYDQLYRWGEKGDYDCSAAVISAWENAGVPVKTKGATYTGNMLSAFKKCGFKDITSTINLYNGSGLKRGDVLLNQTHHAAMYCGNGYEVEASINEKAVLLAASLVIRLAVNFSNALTGIILGQTFCAIQMKCRKRLSLHLTPRLTV